MRSLRAIPRRLLSDTCSVRVRLTDGTYAKPRTILHVRFEYAQSHVSERHRFADAGAGVLYVDSVSSTGAFELHVGDLVEIDGIERCVYATRRYCGFNGRIHHWEVGLK